ncbi:hypothetical protein OU5_5555 [Pseudomonas mandelii JR-1]|uniref:Uncharacterized protein n=2 Tax=Pseudomonas mandelii TaxID=75612 RepID=A0A024EI48_9PSED|nr:hypothetical protein OU5_5555 [Pseudomonas mandelii JR-1]
MRVFLPGENMAKTIDTPVSDEQPIALPVPELRLKFRDKVYTSRTLIIPRSGRALSVAKGLVEVATSDSEALTFLKASEEFEQFKE